MCLLSDIKKNIIRYKNKDLTFLAMTTVNLLCFTVKASPVEPLMLAALLQFSYMAVTTQHQPFSGPI